MTKRTPTGRQPTGTTSGEQPGERNDRATSGGSRSSDGVTADVHGSDGSVGASVTHATEQGGTVTGSVEADVVPGGVTVHGEMVGRADIGGVDRRVHDTAVDAHADHDSASIGVSRRDASGETTRSTNVAHEAAPGGGRVSVSHQEGAATVTAGAESGYRPDGFGMRAGVTSDLDVGGETVRVSDVSVAAQQGADGGSVGYYERDHTGSTTGSVEAAWEHDGDSVGASVSHRFGDHTNAVSARAELDDDGFHARTGFDVSTGDATATPAEAVVDIGGGTATAGVYQRDPAGAAASYAEVGGHQDADGAGAHVEGRFTQGSFVAEGGVRHDASATDSGSRATTSANAGMGNDHTAASASFDKTTSHDDDRMSDTTTIAGQGRHGDAHVSGSRTVAHEETARTRTDHSRTAAEIDTGATELSGSHAHTERVFDTDESETGSAIGDQVLNTLLGNGARPVDHEDVTRTEVSAGDVDAAATFTRGYDLDGNRGEGWTGQQLGADYSERSWSSQEIDIDGFEVAHRREQTNTVDHNPLDGDLENSSAHRETVRIGEHEAEYRNESTTRADIDPFDGDVSHEAGGHRSVTIDDTELSHASGGRTSADVDLTDGGVGVSTSGNSNTIVGENRWESSDERDVHVGKEGLSATHTSDTRTVVGGVETTSESSTQLDVDAGGVRYENTQSSSGPIASSRSHTETTVDTDARDGSVGISGESARSTTGGIVDVEHRSSGHTVVGPAGVEHDAERSTEVRIGDIDAGASGSSRVVADLGGVDASGSGSAHVGGHASVDSTTTAQLDADPFDGSIGARASHAVDGDILGTAFAGAGHAAVDMNAGGSSAEGSATFLGSGVHGSTHIDHDESTGMPTGGGVSGEVDLFGFSFRGSVDTSSGVGVEVEGPAGGAAPTPGEAVDDALAGAGQAAEQAGDAIEQGLDDLGDLAAGAGEMVGSFLGGDDDDEDDDGTLGDAIDDLFGW
jgi:hypothetical protein